MYIDVFFMVNYCLDWIILYVTKSFLKNHQNLIRICIGAFAGAVYSCIVICTSLSSKVLLLNILNVGVAGLMSAISFPVQQLRDYIRQTIQLYIVTFIAGGIMNMLYYSTQFGVWFRNCIYGEQTQGVFYTGVRFICMVILTYTILTGVSRFFFEWKRRQKNRYIVRIIHKEQTVSCYALYDTGNVLFEPVSRECVHIAEYAVLKSILESDTEILSSMVVIPYHSVGEENGVLYGIRVERMIVGECVIEKPIIAIYKGKLSAGENYGMILNCETFEKDYVNG